MHHVKFDMLCVQMDEEWVEEEQNEEKLKKNSCVWDLNSKSLWTHKKLYMTLNRQLSAFKGADDEAEEKQRIKVNATNRCFQYFSYVEMHA